MAEENHGKLLPSYVQVVSAALEEITFEAYFSFSILMSLFIDIFDDNRDNIHKNKNTEKYNQYTGIQKYSVADLSSVEDVQIIFNMAVELW